MNSTPVAESAKRTIGFDTVTCVSFSVAQEFVAAGYGFCGRYLDRAASSDAPPPGTHLLSIEEMDDLLSAGLAIIPIQTGYLKLVPDADGGSRVGDAAAGNAAKLGVPSGVTLWCDLEWQEYRPSAAGTIEYANAWYNAVCAGGYTAGLYVGPNVPLSGQQLYEELLFEHYWKSASAVPWVESRGFQVLQGCSQKVFGIEIDPDLVVLDNRREVPTWVAGRTQSDDAPHR